MYNRALKNFCTKHHTSQLALSTVLHRTKPSCHYKHITSLKRKNK